MSRRKSKSPKINTQLTNKILGMGSGQNYQVGGGERFLTKSTENTFYNGDVRNPILDYDDMMTLRTEQKPSRRTNNSKNRNPKANFEMFKSKNIGIGSGIFANAEMNVNG
jgi:hypothetical protein